MLICLRYEIYHSVQPLFYVTSALQFGKAAPSEISESAFENATFAINYQIQTIFFTQHPCMLVYSFCIFFSIISR